MQQLLTYSFLLLCGLLTTVATAQNRFIDPIFQVGAPETDVTYCENISILTGTPALEELKTDIYMPVGDDEGIQRPVVVLWPTGNFLPAYINQGAYGTRTDSAMVEISKRLVARGYVAMVASYRSGWLPTAEDLETRTGSLLRAAYRGGQDAHAMARFLRKTVAEESNPYMIDTSRIIFWGLGTGGYVTMTHAFLDDYNEILTNDQFYDADGNPLVIESVHSNPQGTTATEFQPGAPSNIPNHINYSSDVAMSINAGGALGDPAWMNGGGNEPMVLAYHSFLDPFAPFYEGTVIVPTTNQTVVGGVAGGNQVVELANASGLNTALEDANALTLGAEFPALSTVVNQISAAYAANPVSLGGLIPTATSDTFPLGRDNLYTWTRPTGSLGVLSTPFNWFDEPTLRFIISQYPEDLGLNADAIIGGEGLTNPNWNNPSAAKAYIDTMMAHFIPRAYIGLDLANPTAVEELVEAAAIGLQVSPNPASDYLLLETEISSPIQEAAMYDINGRQVAVFKGINNSSLRINSSTYPKGYYVLKIRVPQGVTSQKVMIH